MNPAILAGANNPALIVGFVAASVLAYLGFGYLVRKAGNAKKTGSDLETMARMLASETENRRAKEYIGQITKVRAARAGKSVTLLVTSGQGYGKQKRGSTSFYASTDKPGKKEDYEVASSILNGKVTLDRRIDESKVGSWIERKQGNKSLNGQEQDTLILARQYIWNEGIIGIVDGTGWVIFQKGAKPIGRNQIAEIAKKYKDAKDGEGRERAIKDGSTSEDSATLNGMLRLV